MVGKRKRPEANAQTKWVDSTDSPSGDGKNLPALAFDCCALSLEPFVTPVLSPASGAVYDLANIVPLLKKTGKDPISGTMCSREDLIPLHFAKNEQGDYHCPVLFRTFNAACHIVAIKATGNVFLFEALKTLCIDPGTWRDPLTNQTFAGREDIVDIQDPKKPPRSFVSSINDQQHLRQEPSGENVTPPPSKLVKPIPKSATAPSIRMPGIGSKIMQMAKKAETERLSGMSSLGVTKRTAGTGEKSKFSSGLAAASLTSTAFDPVTSNELAEATPEEVEEQRWERIKALKKKGYVQLQTTHGELNLELHADLCPRTCENFLTLAAQGYYDGVGFHRLIKGFMIQGGDPTGTGTGGSSMWKRPFKDEIAMDGNPLRKHSKRGIVAMANSGPNTNGSQFYITFAPCSHLDKKHTVFGRLVGGFDVLDKIERVPVNAQDRPHQTVAIKQVLVFSNPIEEERKGATAGRKIEDSKPAPVASALSTSVPSYTYTNTAPTQQKKVPKKTTFKNFDAW